ncbi:pyrimidine 5'-nucleotidase [Shewanella inventionis]|uniref:dUMP phosphatase n=1 Tax=Shewanella inventionis TaxID=1738770 RepID=A0ABQ1ILZ1_9GAMM|nr:pyrimidine 5'-nucleotidase [Shewanella inventionis]MCL1156304.1 pyrimidine 5'-nucleotidase [Shewanella inventionis]UAL43334.1 pyrimidine 5'-nucleotidase [Shewanella inventionis]GGB44489.1 dUMP phosphatase [Shewanella inventionis]
MPNLLSKYKWILFDADETLFHFDAFSGLKLMFSRFDIDFNTDDFDRYQQVNKPLWVDYQNGVITAAHLQHTRFNEWAHKLSVTPQELNSHFLTAMADICQPLPGARELVDSLIGRVNLGIITNGFTELQSVRLSKTGFEHAFSPVVISEQIGKAKPDIAIFNHAFSLMGEPEKHQVLMVGDNLHSDILGGNKAGIDTCWLNHHGEAVSDDIAPSYQVKTLTELHQLLLQQ